MELTFSNFINYGKREKTLPVVFCFVMFDQIIPLGFLHRLSSHKNIFFILVDAVYSVNKIVFWHPALAMKTL